MKANIGNGKNVNLINIAIYHKTIKMEMTEFKLQLTKIIVS